MIPTGTRLYLAARYSRREELVAYALTLVSRGYGVTSRWLGGAHDTAQPTAADRAAWAAEDWADLLAAHCVVSFTEQPKALLANPGRGGRHVEFGASLAWGKQCIVIGPLETVFHCLPDVQHFDTWDAFLAWLDGGSS